MNALGSLVKKEIRSYLNSAIAYIVVVFFLVFTSVWLFYIQQFFALDRASLRPYFSIFPIVFILLLPALTMRAWAEENKVGTVELLVTYPFREHQLVLGKYLGAMALFGAMVVLTLPVPISLLRFGDFEGGQILGEYVGVLLLGSAGISIGLFISSSTNNQITAFLLSVVVLLMLTLIGEANAMIDLPDALRDFVAYVSLSAHFENLVRGVIDSRDVVYFGLVTFTFLYLNTKLLVFRKWR